jgi:hypothetical protein
MAFDWLAIASNDNAWSFVNPFVSPKDQLVATEPDSSEMNNLDIKASLRPDQAQPFASIEAVIAHQRACSHTASTAVLHRCRRFVSLFHHLSFWSGSMADCSFLLAER